MSSSNDGLSASLKKRRAKPSGSRGGCCFQKRPKGGEKHVHHALVVALLVQFSLSGAEAQTVQGWINTTKFETAPCTGMSLSSALEIITGGGRRTYLELRAEKSTVVQKEYKCLQFSVAPLEGVKAVKQVMEAGRGVWFPTHIWTYDLTEEDATMRARSTAAGMFDSSCQFTPPLLDSWAGGSDIYAQVSLFPPSRGKELRSIGGNPELIAETLEKEGPMPVLLLSTDGGELATKLLGQDYTLSNAIGFGPTEEVATRAAQSFVAALLKKTNVTKECANSLGRYVPRMKAQESSRGEPVVLVEIRTKN